MERILAGFRALIDVESGRWMEDKPSPRMLVASIYNMQPLTAGTSVQYNMLGIVCMPTIWARMKTFHLGSA